MMYISSISIILFVIQHMITISQLRFIWDLSWLPSDCLWPLNLLLHCTLRLVVMPICFYYTSAVLILNLPVWNKLFLFSWVNATSELFFVNSSSVYCHVLLFVCWTLSAEVFMRQNEVRKVCVDRTWFIWSKDFIVNVVHKRDWLYYCSHVWPICKFDWFTEPICYFFTHCMLAISEVFQSINTISVYLRT